MIGFAEADESAPSADSCSQPCLQVELRDPSPLWPVCDCRLLENSYPLSSPYTVCGYDTILGTDAFMVPLLLTLWDGAGVSKQAKDFINSKKAPSFGRNIQVLSRLTERRRSSPGDVSKSAHNESQLPCPAARLANILELLPSTIYSASSVRLQFPSY